jgi:hypothetical protein
MPPEPTAKPSALYKRQSGGHCQSVARWDHRVGSWNKSENDDGGVGCQVVSHSMRLGFGEIYIPKNTLTVIIYPVSAIRTAV